MIQQLRFCYFVFIIAWSERKCKKQRILDWKKGSPHLWEKQQKLTGIFFCYDTTSSILGDVGFIVYLRNSSQKIKLLGKFKWWYLKLLLQSFLPYSNSGSAGRDCVWCHDRSASRNAKPISQCNKISMIKCYHKHWSRCVREPLVYFTFLYP